MAPESGVLKRQRSRPSDWWAVPPTSTTPIPANLPQQQNEQEDGTPKKKKRGRPSGGGIVEKSDAGNRGKPATAGATDGGEKPLRRGRSSGGEVELRALGEGSKAPRAISKRKGKEKSVAVEPVVEKEKASRRGRLSGGEAELRELEESSKGVGEKNKGKDMTAQVENNLVEKGKQKSLRRGRSSEGQVELRVMGETTKAGGKKAETVQAQGFMTKKLGRSTAIQIDELAEEPMVPKRRGRPAAARVEEQVEDEPREEALLKKRDRLAAVQVDELAEEEDVEPVAPKRRGRTLPVHVEDHPDELLAEEPRETSPKRKSRRAASSVEEQPGEEAPKVSKRRGRSSISQLDQPAIPAPAPIKKFQETSKKRGRPAAMDPAADVAAEEPVAKKRRKRMSNVEILEQQSAHFADSITPARGRTRTRPSDANEPEPSQPKEQKRGKSDVQAEIIHEPSSSRVEHEDRGRRRTRRSDAELEEAVPQPSTKGASKIIKPSRRSEVVEVEAASSRLTKIRGDKGPKPSANAAPKAAPKASRTLSAPQTSSKPRKGGQSSKSSVIQKTVSAPSQTQRKASKQSSQVEAPSRKRKGIENVQPELPKRQRVEKATRRDRDDEAEAETELPTPQQLKAITRKVSRQTIENKWEALQQNCVDLIQQMLHDIQRPVVARLHDEKKRTQASTALQMVSGRLLKKIYRGLPFPPGTRSHREDDFDFEKILDNNRALEAQLTPALHSNELLEAELRKETAWLESDKEKLADLEDNAKREAASRNQAARKLHSILQSEYSTAEIETLKDDIGLDVNQQFQALDLSVQDDENLQALVKELDGHVDTIQGNIKQVQGISQAMANSRAAVQATLFHHLDSAQYDEVVLGLE